MASLLTERDRAILKAVCDTVVPSIERDRDPDRLWGRSASDLGVDQGAAQLIGPLFFALLTDTITIDRPFCDRVIDRFLTACAR